MTKFTKKWKLTKKQERQPTYILVSIDGTNGVKHIIVQRIIINMTSLKRSILSCFFSLRGLTYSKMKRAMSIQAMTKQIWAIKYWQATTTAKARINRLIKKNEGCKKITAPLRKESYSQSFPQRLLTRSSPKQWNLRTTFLMTMNGTVRMHTPKKMQTKDCIVRPTEAKLTTGMAIMQQSARMEQDSSITVMGKAKQSDRFSLLWGRLID